MGAGMSASKRPVALITGASAGIGAALAREFVRKKHDVVLAARRRDRLEALAAEFPDRARVVVADLATTEGALALHREAGPVDVLVNNAGAGAVGRFDLLDLDWQLRILQVNIVALTALTRAYLPEMVARASGRVLNVASIASFQPGPGMAVYCATKAYVLSLSEALSSELSGTGVTVTALCPGATRSEFADKAGMNGTRFFRIAMDADRVALRGVSATLAGERLAVPGAANAAQTFAVRFLPRGLVLAAGKRVLMGLTGGKPQPGGADGTPVT